jgi:hypothetical protein
MDILVIPDTQVRLKDPLDHLEALGNFAVENEPEYIIHLGDHWDMNSLSVYDMGKKAGENARYQDDIEAGINALLKFQDPITSYRNKQCYQKKKLYNPTKLFLIGNHEERINRHVNAHPYLAGKLSYKDFYLDHYGWELIPYLQIIEIEGVRFSHYFVNPDSAKNYPFSGGVDFQLKSLGFSFVQGHKQGLELASPRYYPDGKVIRGIIAGSFYEHDFDYLGPQKTNYWRGALLLEDVKNGMYRLKELPLNWLKENYL